MMNKVVSRAKIMLVLALVLAVGTLFFVGEYLFKAESWVMFAGSPHVYNGSNIGCGMIVDRDGVPLLDLSGSRTYASEESIRRSFVHWVGDRKGSVSAPALSHYAKELSGYDLLSGFGYELGLKCLKLSLTHRYRGHCLYLFNAEMLVIKRKVGSVHL